MSEQDDLDLEAAVHNPTRRLAIVVIVVLVVAAVGVGGYWGWVKLSVASEDAWEPVFDAEKTSIGDIDLARVHAEVWPKVCFSQRGSEEEKAAFEAVKEAVSDDETLSSLASKLREANDLDPSERFPKQRELLRQWNGYLVEKGIPLEVQMPIHIESRPQFSFCLLSYAIVADFEVEAGGQKIRTRLGSREDRINIVESYLGHASDKTRDAFITIDTTADAAATDLWPLLDESEPERLSPLDARFAPMIRKEFAAELDPAHFEQLTALSKDRRALVEIRQKVVSRQECGSTLDFSPFVPLRGLSDRSLDFLGRHARSPGAQCPPILFSEHERLRESSWALRHAPGLRDSVRALTAAAARGVVFHEARHVLDAHDGLTCETCPEWLGKTGRRELSAYLAALGHGSMPFTYLHHVCGIKAEGRGPHRRAAHFLIDKVLDKGCKGELPDDLAARARAMEEEVFGRSTPIPLPSGYPKILPSHRY